MGVSRASSFARAHRSAGSRPWRSTTRPMRSIVRSVHLRPITRAPTQQPSPCSPASSADASGRAVAGRSPPTAWLGLCPASPDHQRRSVQPIKSSDGYRRRAHDQPQARRAPGHVAVLPASPCVPSRSRTLKPDSLTGRTTDPRVPSATSTPNDVELPRHALDTSFQPACCATARRAPRRLPPARGSHRQRRDPATRTAAAP